MRERRSRRRRLAEEQGAAVRRPLQAEGDAEQRGLPAAVRAGDRHELARSTSRSTPSSTAGPPGYENERRELDALAASECPPQCAQVRAHDA